MKKLFVLLLGVFLCHGAVADQNDFRCLKSIGLKNPIRLQFTFPSVGQDTGYVVYQKGSGPIRVRGAKSKIIRDVPGGRPSEIQTEWVEITGSSIGGKYIIISQGAIISEFTYISRDGKIFKFEVDFDAADEKTCRWTTR